jgi:hypothetical protein
MWWKIKLVSNNHATEEKKTKQFFTKQKDLGLEGPV